MILLTGSTGFVGTHLLKGLLEAGFQVRCLVRPGSPGRDKIDPRAEKAYGDILDKESLVKAMVGVETIIHLVGIIEEGPGVSFEAIHVLGAKDVVDAAIGAGVKKFIHMSALGSRESAASRYHRTKWQAEQYVKASGLNFTIFRPAIIFGPGDGFMNRLAQLMGRLPVIPIIGTGKYEFQPIYIEDVVRCFVQAAQNPLTIRGTFELGGPEKLTFNEIIEIIRNALGVKKGTIHIPMAVMKPLVWFMDRFLKHPPVNREQLMMLEEGNVCDITQMKEVFHPPLAKLREEVPRYISRRVRPEFRGGGPPGGIVPPEPPKG